jgi:F0F1-type ATP synthase assembly protein I
MKKRYIWLVALAVVGGILATKTAKMSAASVLEGCVGGGGIGFIIGWLLDRSGRIVARR